LIIKKKILNLLKLYKFNKNLMNFHSEGKKEKSFIALTSVFAAIFLTTFKTVIGFSTGSLGILSEAAHSALDLVAAVITYFAVRAADKPADRDHHFGHGKVENISALIETILLLITCIWIIYEAVQRIFFKSVEIEINVWSFIVVIIAIVVDISRSRALNRVAKKYDSQALEADALHFQTDVWSSSVVLIGLVFALYNFHLADSIAGLFVAIIVIWVSYKLGKRTIDALLDRVPSGIEERIKLQVLKLPEIENCKDLRIRQSGARTFIDLTVSIKRTLQFEQVHDVLTKVEQEVGKIIPSVDIIIHPEPIKSKDETIMDKVRLISAKYGFGIHEFQKHLLSDFKHSIDLHIELKPEMSFKEAHDISTTIENEIYKEIPEIGKISIHLEEPLPIDVREVDITNKSNIFIEELRSIALEDSNIHDCKNFAIFESSGKYKISMDCEVDNDLKLEEVHNLVTSIEDKIKDKYKKIEKITIHAEPIE
jgi:cation diffusion facilitator family transporter